MNKKKIEIIYTEKKREQCGDCYYNGFCKTNLRQCPYLKKRKS